MLNGSRYLKIHSVLQKKKTTINIKTRHELIIECLQDVNSCLHRIGVYSELNSAKTLFESSLRKIRKLLSSAHRKVHRKLKVRWYICECENPCRRDVITFSERDFKIDPLYREKLGELPYNTEVWHNKSILILKNKKWKSMREYFSQATELRENAQHGLFFPMKHDIGTGSYWILTSFQSEIGGGNSVWWEYIDTDNCSEACMLF